MDVQRDRAGEPVNGNEKRAARRDALLEAAVGAIRAQGPGVTMEQLANAGGVTKPILYRHFGDRDGLITAISDRFADALMGEIVAPLKADSTGRELLRNTVDAYVGFIERETNLYRFMVQHPPERRDRTTSISALVDNVAKQVAQILGSRLANAGRDPAPAVAWAYGIVGLVHQAGDWWVDDQTMSRESLVDDLILLLWDGIAGGSATDALAGDA